MLDFLKVQYLYPSSSGPSAFPRREVIPSEVVTRRALRDIAADPAFLEPVRAEASSRASRLTSDASKRLADARWARDHIRQTLGEVYLGAGRVWPKVTSTLLHEVGLLTLGCLPHHAVTLRQGIENALRGGDMSTLVCLLRSQYNPSGSCFAR